MAISNTNDADLKRQVFPSGVFTKRTVLAVVIACLLLALYIGFLLVSNYRSHKALREFAINRCHLDLEKRAATLGYYFSERKYDLNLWALSHEIKAYYFNKALGMTEQYGLKVNLFMIERLLASALDNRRLQNGHRIYSRLVLIDDSGRKLADTTDDPGTRETVYFPRNNRTADEEPQVIIVDGDKTFQMLLSVPCRYKNKVVGELIAWLDSDTLYSHFIDLAEYDAPGGSGLAAVDGSLHTYYRISDREFAATLTPDWIATLPETNFALLQIPGNGRQTNRLNRLNTMNMLVTSLPIPNQNLRYVAWIPLKQIAGALAPWRMIMGMATLALLIMVGFGLVLWFFGQNLLLKTRFDESKRQQKLLSNKNRQLEIAIQKREEAESALEAQRTMRVRSDRLRSLGEMAAGIAHELNQPLVGVRGFAEIMKDAIDNDMDLSRDEIQEYSGLIMQQADRMVHIINHVRLFARDAGNIETAIVDLNKVVDAGATLLRAQFDSHGLILVSQCTDQPLPILVNPYSVEEVIFNLLSNARHSVEQKNAISDETYQPEIRITTEASSTNGVDKAVLRVTDNGTGIPDYATQRIFDPFFTTKDPDKGTGLGLAICKSIVESFQGQIRFETATDKGTSFEITFPCAQAEGNA